MIKHQGKSRHRFKDNPLEKAFADAWEARNSHKPFDGLLAQLMSRHQPLLHRSPEDDITERDALVAATVVQWLGSHVGQCFLAEVIATREGADLRSRIQDEVQRIVNEGRVGKGRKRASTLYPEED